VEKYGQWFEVHTREGRSRDDEWIELMGGSLKGDGRHFHQGINKDMTNRFDRRRGVVKASLFFAANALTGERLDEDRVGKEFGEHNFVFRTRSSKVTRKVWVSEADIVRGVVPDDPLIIPKQVADSE
jgi:hypothetical protein